MVMKKALLIVIPILFLSFPVSAQETHVLREWNDNRNIEYLQLKGNYYLGRYRTYTIRTVYGDLQEKE